MDVYVYKQYNIEDKLLFSLTFLKLFVVPVGLALRIKSITDYYSFIDVNGSEKINVITKYLLNKDVTGNERWTIFWERLKTSTEFKKKFMNTPLRENFINESYYYLSQSMIDASIYQIRDNPSILGNGIFLRNSCIQKELLTLLSSIH